MDAEAGAERRLVLLRHAKSSRDDAGLTDHERPLTPRGRRDAAAAGRWIAAQVGTPDVVLCSTALRTRQTWAEASGAAPGVLGSAPVRYEDAIYQAWPDGLLALLHDVADEARTVVLVGHGPGVPDLAERLNRVNGTGPVGDYQTSAVAVFAVAGTWSELGPDQATLTAFEVPRG